MYKAIEGLYYKTFFLKKCRCRVRKLFRIRIKNEEEIRKVVKLSDRKIRWIVRHCYIEKDVSTKEAARIYGVR